ncbi:MAG TPA: nitroreductase family protein [Gemmatimonadota bacterium]|nr:nitroreductase family protein [Gemmatimonadota bacterium]
MSGDREHRGSGTPAVRFVPLSDYRAYPEDEMLRRATAFRTEVARRRTVRHFSDRAVPRAVIEECLRAAGTAPSGANLQPWHFVVVSDPVTKRRIRERAEIEEREFYRHRAPKEWLEALAPLGTDEHKPFLETAPCLIVVFAERYGRRPDGTRFSTYYAIESVGLATGLLIAAIHHAGLVSLTHTPSPMRFLNRILDRPANEKPFLILVVGYPAEDAVVPDIGRKPLLEIATFR